ncbi:MULTISPECIES: type II toxin-antitoxin system RelB/DinJ family antitoxin [Lactobacillaceae]|uniref:type II toxin-antitoxin system RelB/DinJ family antitoxin n=1 Tax=Lactobacillaceae TaxID=33958 RepID=UPI0007BC4190|nr:MULTISPECIES: type II toxin-antitoxin system RelB/DinJ family antitoxin [Lactobacillaceae]KZU18105.1 DNA-damage-inducible [Lactiplantibacillus plantarum]KZU18625.1 DNA-damage-inducible [Lactiplantibacillus plantarum]MCT1175213.1 hypothetical protein [Pediococcus pentosaceus]
MDEKKRVRVQIDKELADKAEEILDEVGLSATTAINIFYRKVAMTDQFPFSISEKKEA